MSSQELASNNNQVPEGYKKTEIGVIPEDWDVVSITKATSAIFLGLTAKVDYVNSGGIPLIRATDIASGRLKFSDARSISVRQHKQLTRYRRPKKEDVLVSKSGSLGVCAIVDVDRDFSIYESIIVIQSNSLLNSNFLLWLVRDERTQIRIIGEKVGSTVGHLNLEMFRKLLIPLPPLPEQKAIAQTLSDVDVLIAELDKLIAKKRHIKTATMQQLLTGKTRLQGFGGEWEVKRLGVLAKFYKGMGLSKAELTKFGKNECIHYGELFTTYCEKISIVVSKTNKEKNVFYSQKNDVLMPTSDVTPNGLATASCIKKSDVILGGDILIIRSSKEDIEGEFLAYAIKLNRNQIMQLISGTTVFHLYGRDMARFIFSIPISLPEQKAIAQVLSDMDEEITALEKRRAKTQTIKQGMMQELLTGRTRLI